MSGMSRCFRMWTENPDSINHPARQIGDELGLAEGTVNLYKHKFRKEGNTVPVHDDAERIISDEAVSSGRRLRKMEAKRVIVIETAVSMLKKEGATFEEMVRAWSA